MKYQIIAILLIAFLLAITKVSVCAGELTGNNILKYDQAVEQALKADLTLQAAKLNLEIAKKDYESAKRVLSIGGVYSVIESDPGGRQTLAKTLGTNSGGIYDTTTDHIYSKWYLEYKPVDQDNYSYHLSYTPFNLGHDKHVKTMELNYISQDLNYQNTRNKLIMDVRNAYAEAVQKEELYKLAVHDLELFRNKYKRSTNLYDSGKISRLDLMDAEQQLRAAEVKLNIANLNYQAGLLKLSVLLGIDDLKDISLELATLEGATPNQVDLQATIEQYLINSLDLKVAEIKIQVEKVQKRMDSFCLFKNVYICTGETRTNGVEATYYGIGFKGSLDDSYYRDYRASKKKLEAARLNREIVISNKRTQIKEAFRNWEMSELNLKPIRQILDIARERLKIAGQKYDQGMASGSELDQAYLLLNKAEEGYWGAWLNLQCSREFFYQSVDGEPVLKDEQYLNNLSLRGDD